jgi:hypothetical protein
MLLSEITIAHALLADITNSVGRWSSNNSLSLDSYRHFHVKFLFGRTSLNLHFFQYRFWML